MKTLSEVTVPEIKKLKPGKQLSALAEESMDGCIHDWEKVNDIRSYKCSKCKQFENVDMYKKPSLLVGVGLPLSTDPTLLGGMLEWLYKETRSYTIKSCPLTVNFMSAKPYKYLIRIELPGKRNSCWLKDIEEKSLSHAVAIAVAILGKRKGAQNERD